MLQCVAGDMMTIPGLPTRPCFYEVRLHASCRCQAPCNAGRLFTLVQGTSSDKLACGLQIDIDYDTGRIVGLS